MKLVSKSWIYNNLQTSLQNNSSVNSIVKSIIEDVKKNGDNAILKYVKKFENPKATLKNIKFTKKQLKEAYDSISAKQKN